MFPHLSSGLALPLPLVHGFPMFRVLSVSPTSTTASASLWMFLLVGILEFLQDCSGSPRFLSTFFSIRAMLSGPAEVSSNHCPISVTYYSLPNVRLCRPSVPNLTRLNSFTCVTARTSLCLRLAHVVTSISPRLDSW